MWFKERVLRYGKMTQEFTRANVLTVLDRINDRLDATRLIIRKQISKTDHKRLVDLTLELQCVHDVLKAEDVMVSSPPTTPIWGGQSDCASTCECHQQPAVDRKTANCVVKQLIDNVKFDRKQEECGEGFWFQFLEYKRDLLGMCPDSDYFCN